MKRFFLFFLFSFIAHAVLFLIFGQTKWLSSNRVIGHPSQLTVMFSNGSRLNSSSEVSNVSDLLAETSPYLAHDWPTSKPIQSDIFLNTTSLARNASVREKNNNLRSTSEAEQASMEDLRNGDNQYQEIVGDKETEHSARHLNHTHPSNWLAFVVTVSEDGKVLEYTQVSKGDANASIYSMVTNEIKRLKIPEAMYGQKILVSAPPLKIETDPAITAEFL